MNTDKELNEELLKILSQISETIVDITKNLVIMTNKLEILKEHIQEIEHNEWKKHEYKYWMPYEPPNNLW